MNSLDVSRREFCLSTLAASSLMAAGVPRSLPALAIRGRAPDNVPVSDDGNVGHLEPCLAVNPCNPRNLLAACELSSGALATYVSFDGGLTWQSNGPLPMPAGTPAGGNVSAGFDSTGRGLVCGLVAAPGSLKGAARGVYVWGTEDGGRTFTPPVAVTGYSPLDRPWLATERRWPQAVHVVWTAGYRPGDTTSVGYARSADGGLTFEAPRTIASVTSGLGDAMVACGPPGGVYVIYGVGKGVGSAGLLETTVTQPTDTPATVTVLCSRDRGQTFGPPIEIGRGTINVSFPGLPGTSDSLPAIAAGTGRGLVCAVFSVQKHDAGHAGVVLTASKDAGRTWTPATAVTPQDQVIYFEPQVTIDDAGRIGVMAFAWARGMVSVVLMVSEPGSLRFGPPITITSQPFNPALGEIRGNGMWSIGDYQALAATPGAFHPLWNDTRTGQLQLFTATVPTRRR
jgi:hypothetical protein